jgi:hypothetical protein
VQKIERISENTQMNEKKIIEIQKISLVSGFQQIVAIAKVVLLLLIIWLNFLL